MKTSHCEPHEDTEKILFRLPKLEDLNFSSSSDKSQGEVARRSRAKKSHGEIKEEKQKDGWKDKPFKETPKETSKS